MQSPLPWRLLMLSVLLISLSTLPVFLLGAGFLQIGRDLGFSVTGLGVLTALFFLTASAVSPVLGKVVHRIGWRKAIRINAVASSILLVAIGAFARSTIVLGIFMVLSAAAYGLANPSANVTLARYVDSGRSGLTFGLKHAGIPTSTLLAGLAVPTLILSIGWRWAYGMAALLGLAVLALVPSQSLLPPEPAGAEDPRREVAALSTRRLIGLAAGSGLATWAAIALGTYLVAAVVDNGFSESAGGLLLFAGSAASILGRVSAGRLADHIGSPGFGVFASLAAAGAVVFALLPTASGAAFAILVLIAFVTGWGWPGLMTYTVVNANRGTVAASSGVAQSGVFIGAGTSPLLIGWIADRWSFDAAWLVVAVGLAGAATIVWLVGRSTAMATARSAG